MSIAEESSIISCETVRPMLFCPHRVTKGGKLTFAAVCMSGGYAQIVYFAKSSLPSGSMQRKRSTIDIRTSCGERPVPAQADGDGLDHRLLQSARNCGATHQGRQAATNWTASSYKGMVQNGVRLQQHALVYNVNVFLHGTDLTNETPMHT